MLRKRSHVSEDRDKRKQAQRIIIIPIHPVFCIRRSTPSERLRLRQIDGSNRQKNNLKETNGQEYRPDVDTTEH
jgi:hypothetical protein